MPPRGKRNFGTHLLDMFVRASLLAEAHLPLDRRTLGAWTAPGLPSKQCKQTRARTIQGGPGTAHQTPPRRGGRICCCVEPHMAHPEQRLHHQLVDTTQPRDIRASGRKYRRQRTRILGDRYETTSRRRTDTKVQGTRLMLCQRNIARQPREPSSQVTSPVQPPDSNEEPALLTRLRIYLTEC